MSAPKLLERSFGAVVVDWGGLSGSARPGDLVRTRARLARLSALGVHVGLVGEPTPTGIHPRDRMDGLLRRLDLLGLSGELVLVLVLAARGDGRARAGRGGGDPRAWSCPHRPVVVPVGGTRAVLTLTALLDEQLDRARQRRVPGTCEDPRWSIIERGVDPRRHLVTESLFTLSSGGVGLRGSLEEAPGLGQPLLVAAGVWSGPGVADGLLPGPDVLDLDLRTCVTQDVRTLDLRTGVLHRREVGDEPAVRSARFASIVEPGVLAVRAEAATTRLPHLVPGGWEEWSCVPAPGGGGLGALVHEQVRRGSTTSALQRLVAVEATSTGPPDAVRARDRMARAEAGGFEALLAGQRSAWARRWERVGVSIPDDPATELGLRFALFQLWGLRASQDELGVGARALTGSGYAGHVFWDADVFVLPALCTIDPATARAMMVYRLNRLEAARGRARADGRRGARFPWESAADGRDVTPGEGGPPGGRVRILTGDLEEHITADVAWAMVHLATWSRPDAVLTGPEARLLGETARYWASRIVSDPDGSAHIRGVIGPDEYHEDVDDNAFTNVLARWNLRTAVRRAPAPPAERAVWAALAAALVDGYDATSGLYEQFRGYFGLRPLLVGDLAEPPVAMDVLLGRGVVAGSQLLKQPDALMIHHLLPHEAVAGSLRANLDFYGPRTCHGSSLSPSVMASLHARAGRPEAALELLRTSLRIDLEDLGGTTAEGVHIGACAGAWRSLVEGFLGAAVERGRLHLDPVLPDGWRDLEVRFGCLGRDVRVRVGQDRIAVDASGPLPVCLGRDCELASSTSSAVELTRCASSRPR